MAAPQQAIDNIWEKYRTALKALEDSLDENNVLGIKNKQALDENELLKQKLKDAGIITAKEFQEKKKKILSNI